MNQYMVEAYPDTHDGRVRRRYVAADSRQGAAEQFHARHPRWMIRTMWELVAPEYYEVPQRIMSGTVEENR